MIEIANNMYMIAESLKMHGFATYTMILYGNRFYNNNQYDHVIRIPKFLNLPIIRNIFLKLYSLCMFPICALKFDIFIFIYGITFLPLRLDIFLLRMLGKKVIMFNCGDDVRYRPIAIKIASHKKAMYYSPDTDYTTYINQGISFRRAFLTQRLEELSGAYILSSREQATFANKHFYHFIFPTKMILSHAKKAGDIPLIIHAPSDRNVKRTDIVLDAIDKLKAQKVQFEFELIENKDNSYVLQRLIEADIVIDQAATWIAKFASEGLAASCVVFGGNDFEYLGLPRDFHSPVIQFFPDSQKLYNDLRHVIDDKEYREDVMRKSYEFWKNNYSPEAFVESFKKIINSEYIVVEPWPDKKEMLMKFSDTWLKKIIIKLFY